MRTLRFANLLAGSASLAVHAAPATARVFPVMLFAGAATLLSVSCLAQQPAAVTAQNAWARATTPGVSTGGVYVTLTSRSGDKLLSASTPAAAKADVHEMQMDGTIMRMRPVPGGLDLPAGKAVSLTPSGYHIMLEGLKTPLRQGSVVPVHLIFQKAPPIDIEASVQSIGAAGPAGSQASRAAMPGMSMPK
jgi:copper(I)-binding protein